MTTSGFFIDPVCLDSVQCFATGIDSQRLLEVFVEYAVDEHRQPGNMIEMRVSQKHVANRPEILKREITDSCASIEQNVIVNEHRGGA